MKTKFKKVFAVAMSVFTFASVLSVTAVPVHAAGLDVDTAFTQVVGSHAGKGNWHYSWDGGKHFGMIMSDGDPSADEYYNVGLDCSAGTLSVMSRAIKNAGGDPRKFFGNCDGQLNNVGVSALKDYFTNMSLVATSPVDASELQPGDILVYGNAHMNIYAGGGQTIDFASGGAGRPTYTGWATYLDYATSSGSGSSKAALSAVYRLNLSKDISVSVKKKSTCENITNGNRLYSDLTATFGVYKDANCTSQLGTITTSVAGDGSASYTVDSDVNTVYIKELTAPTNYELSDSTAHVVDVSGGMGYSEFSDMAFNDPIRLTMTKVDADGKTVTHDMSGAEFTVKYYDTLGASSNTDLTSETPKKTWTFKTIKNNGGKYIMQMSYSKCYVGGDELYKDASGNTTFPLGTYTLQETKSPTGYTVEGGYAKQNNEVFEASEVLFVKHEKAGGKYLISYGNNLSDPELIKTEKSVRGGFAVTKVDETTGRRVQGDARFANAKFDLYYIDSQSEPGKGITVKADVNGNGTYDADEEFNPGDKVTTITLDENGLYTSSKDFLDYGKYKLVEAETPVGYAACSDIEFNVDQEEVVVPLTATEKVYEGDISIHKTYSTSTQSGFAKNEAGAVFDVVAAKYVKMYAADPDNITREDVITALSHKDDFTGTDEDGDVVTGFTAQEWDQLTTDANGKATSKKLAYGDYYLAQESGKENYEAIDGVVPFSITEEHQDTLTFEGSNLPRKYTLKMFKRDADTGELVTLDSAAFKVKKLTDAEGKDVSNVTDKKLGLKNGYVTQVVGDGSDKTVYSVFKTVSTNATSEKLEAGMFYPANSEDGLESEKGSVAVPLELEAGTYRLEEVVTPNGFATGQSFEFRIDDANITRVNEWDQNVIEVTMKDNQIRGNFSIAKTLDEFEGADKSFVNHDLTQFGFTLTASEDIINPDDGSVLVKAGEEAVKFENGGYVKIGEVFADENGHLSFDELPLGKYTLTETTHPAGTIENTHAYAVEVKQTAFDKKVADADVTAKDFEVTIDGDTVTSKTKAVDFEIDNFVTKIGLSKTSLTGKEELPGAHITLTDAEGNVVDEWDSTDTAHKIEGLEVGKSYTMTETLAPLGYYYASEINFTVENSKEIQNVKMIDNPIIYEIKKVDENGNAVEGVKLELTDITDPDNPVAIELPNGGITTKEPFKLDKMLQIEHTYKLVESAWIGGVYKATDIQFTVPKYGSSEPFTITMIDDLTGVNVLKTDETGKAVAGAKMKLIELLPDEDGSFVLGGKTFKEGDTVYEFTSTNKPVDVSKYVKGGSTYALIETEVPFGYEQPTVKNSAGEDVPVATLFTVTGTDEETQLVTFVNNRKHFFVSAVKVDANDDKTLLKGAEITIFNKADNTVAKDVNGKDAVGITDGKGNIVFEMPYSTDGYYAMETGAPEGYSLNPDKFDVVLTEDYNFAKDNPIVIKVADSLLPIEESNSGVAGTNITGGCIALIGGVALAVIALYLLTKNQKKKIVFHKPAEEADEVDNDTSDSDAHEGSEKESE